MAAKELLSSNCDFSHTIHLWLSIFSSRALLLALPCPQLLSHWKQFLLYEHRAQPHIVWVLTADQALPDTHNVLHSHFAFLWLS